MKGWLLVLAIVALTALNIVVAKQSNTPNLRAVSQADQRTVSDQSNKPIDILTTKKIRTELMNDETLSTRAKNIKIITVNKGVTLKGDVESADEREKVLKHAYLTAPKYKIYNQLSVVK